MAKRSDLQICYWYQQIALAGRHKNVGPTITYRPLFLWLSPDLLKFWIDGASWDMSFEISSLLTVCLFLPSFYCLIHFILEKTYTNQPRYFLWNKIIFYLCLFWPSICCLIHFLEWYWYNQINFILRIKKDATLICSPFRYWFKCLKFATFTKALYFTECQEQ